MSDTPRTDALSYISEEAFGRRVVLAQWMENMERELAAVTAERDRMRPVVEAAQRFRKAQKNVANSLSYAEAVNAFLDALDTYEAATCPSATETP